ncbi:MAG: hypothetical protein HWQ38_19280 [Nostoc sp. NMS7]|uniref:hypothetical protein n=1 Tax=Nostoc sp. NMS7 TaxID=2815391 RepID=UPI0025E5AE55|nr:hypothetical protein [Nostoc sp. NMS7]MBN3948478.1 hypothetical protein [Nostoc sp. NMS7]
MQQEIEQLKESLKQNQIINALKKSLYATSGKAGKDEDGYSGYSYFDLICDRAINYIVLDEHGKFIAIDPRDKTPLKILMAYQESESQLCDRIFIHSNAKSASLDFC